MLRAVNAAPCLLCPLCLLVWGKVDEDSSSVNRRTCALWDRRGSGSLQSGNTTRGSRATLWPRCQIIQTNDVTVTNPADWCGTARVTSQATQKAGFYFKSTKWGSNASKCCWNRCRCFTIAKLASAVDGAEPPSRPPPAANRKKYLISKNVKKKNWFNFWQKTEPPWFLSSKAELWGVQELHN